LAVGAAEYDAGDYEPGAGKKARNYAMARYAVGKMFKKAWDADKQPDQWKALAEFIMAKNPKKSA
jgi:hypothetical protein